MEMTSRSTRRLQADAVLLLAALIWGTAFVAQRLVGEQGSVHLFNGARFALAALLLWGVQGFRLQGDIDFWRWASLAGGLLFAGSSLQQAGLQYTTAGNAGFITSLYTVFVPVLLYLFWREKPSVFTVWAVALAVVGAYLLSTGGASFKARRGDLLELIGVIFWAGHVVLLGRFASRYPPLPFATAQFAVTGVLGLVAGAALEWPLTVEPAVMLPAVLYTGIFSVAIAYTLQVWGQRHTPPTDAALILSLESVFALLSGWLVLGETLLPLQVWGCILIFAAVLLSQIEMFVPRSVANGERER